MIETIIKKKPFWEAINKSWGSKIMGMDPFYEAKNQKIMLKSYGFLQNMLRDFLTFPKIPKQSIFQVMLIGSRWKLGTHEVESQNIIPSIG